MNIIGTKFQLVGMKLKSLRKTVSYKYIAQKLVNHLPSEL